MVERPDFSTVTGLLVISLPVGVMPMGVRIEQMLALKNTPVDPVTP